MGEKIANINKDLDKDHNAKKQSEKDQGSDLQYALYDDQNVNSK